MPQPWNTQENNDFLTRQLITCIGNKRALLNFIGQGISQVCRRLGKKRISSFDVFSGSGIVSRYLKQFSDRLLANDIEHYAHIISRCYLTNESEIDRNELDYWFIELQKGLKDSLLKPGFISELYAPADMHNIAAHERCFYTPRNARYIDTARQLIDTIPEHLRIFFLAPLLAQASIHANTAGLFKGFYKNAQTGRGQFGGTRKKSLSRISGNIELELPILSNFESHASVFCQDANSLIPLIEEVDLAYLDPPYNQHPYGSNYFMLNLIADNIRPQHISRISGIPADWQRSAYNKKAHALQVFQELINNIKAKFLVISFNSEGFIERGQMIELLEKTGRTEILEVEYNTFRGSRNLSKRSTYVKEYLYLVEKY